LKRHSDRYKVNFINLKNIYQKQKTNISLYSPYYAEVFNEFVMPISASLRQGNTVTCVDVEAVRSRLQRCVRFSRPLGF